MRFSVVVPALDEAAALDAQGARFERLKRAGAELILVDGGSHDGTVDAARPLFDRTLSSRAGRGCQMNAGTQHASGSWLVFAHMDTSLEDTHLQALARALDREPGRRWGRFDVRLSGRGLRFAVIAWAMNLRSRWTGIATGDQCLFVHADEFAAVGGYPDQPLMEDIELSKRLKRRSPPLCLRKPVTTSSRRWEGNGVARTVCLMWRLRLAYAFGADPQALARCYYPGRSYGSPLMGDRSAGSERAGCQADDGNGKSGSRARLSAAGHPSVRA